MFAWLGPLAMVNQMWHAVPLVIVISLVYAATRHESSQLILSHAARLATSITVFMAVVFAILFFISFYWI